MKLQNLKMSPNNEILNKLIELKPLLSKQYHVSQIGLFGSYAIGNFNDNSDIDILVDFNKPIGWEFFDIQDILYKNLNRKIDLVSIKALKKQLKENILKQTIFV